MPAETLKNITREDFDTRVDANNSRLRQDLKESEERVQRLEALIARKKLFAQRLDQILREVESEQTEITAMEKGVRVPRSSTRSRLNIAHPPR